MAPKITKLISNSLNKISRQKIFTFDWKNVFKDNKQRVPEYKNASGSVTQRSFLSGRTFSYFLRHMTVSVNRYPKIGLFWKTFIYRILKEEKTNFATIGVKNQIISPTQSRGLKSTTKISSSEEPTFQHETELSKEKIPAHSKTAIGVEEETVLKKKTPEVDFNLNLKRPHEQDEAIKSSELPPPQICRLSCPLPPPEFQNTDSAEFRSNYQPPSVRFLSLPEQFLPNPTPQPPPSKVELPMKELPKMKALLFLPNTLELKFDDVNAPVKIYKDEILVEVAYSGVCGTDLFITEGKLSCGDQPIILGQEISGRVYAVGKEVDHVIPGDKVAVNPYTACSVCRYCSRGLFSSCQNEGMNNSIGISKNGGWAEFVVVKKSQVYKVPDQLELDQAVLIQPLSCVLCAMSKLKILHEMDILIQGLGLNGCLWASVLHTKGHKNVIVSENTSKRRSEFESLGTNYSLLSPEDIKARAVDLVVECTGSQDSIETSLNVLNPNGQMCFFTKPQPVTEIRFSPYEIVRKEITIVGNTGNAFHFSKAIDMANVLKDNYLDFNKLGVKTFNLENFKEAFELKKANEVSKIVFRIDS